MVRYVVWKGRVKSPLSDRCDGGKTLGTIISFLGNILGYVMAFCYRIFENYGLAIILFTFFTKVILLPVSIMVHKNSIKMVRMQSQRLMTTLKLQRRLKTRISCIWDMRSKKLQNYGEPGARVRRSAIILERIM